MQCIHLQAFSFSGRMLFFSREKSEFIPVFSSCLQLPVQNALGFANFQPSFHPPGLTLPLGCVPAPTETCKCVLYAHLFVTAWEKPGKWG